MSNPINKKFSGSGNSGYEELRNIPDFGSETIISDPQELTNNPSDDLSSTEHEDRNDLIYNFEELADIDKKSYKSATIIDDLENIKSGVLQAGKVIDFVKLSNKIDKYTIIKKKKRITEKKTKEISGSSAYASEINKTTNKGKTSTAPEIKNESTGTSNKFLSIDIPDNVMKHLPNDFLTNEFGTIDLMEAEKISEEDISDLAGEELFKELDIDYTPRKKHADEKNSQKKTNKQKDITNIIPGKTEISSDGKTINSETDQNEIDHNLSEEVTNQKEENINVANDNRGINTLTPEDKYESLKKSDPDVYPEIEEELIEGTGEKNINDISPPAENNRKEKNILFIDNTEQADVSLEKLTLENDYSGNLFPGTAAFKGHLVELKESDIGSKAISGLIRDNYPSFTDLLKKQEKRRYFDDDIEFINDSILKKDKKSQLYESGNDIVSENELNTRKHTAPFEHITGLSSEEMNFIEKKLFNYDQNKINFNGDFKKISGLDQPKDDIIKHEKYKYILPVRNSLKEEEKKSIEDDISSKTALIVEEDVGQIKLKLEDLMDTIIKETVQDITDRIRIYEENKENGITDQSNEKDSIKKLLVYLNDLLERLPEDSIKNFAESEFYDLYKKVLNDLDK